jgi:hypothetical protein
MRTAVTRITMLTAVCCFGFGLLSAQVAEKNNEIKTETKKEMKQDGAVKEGMKKQMMGDEAECSHCTKDKKCGMHSKHEMKKKSVKEEKVCPHCTKDKQCEMHAKEETGTQAMECSHCTKEKMCEMHSKQEMKKSDKPQ